MAEQKLTFVTSTKLDVIKKSGKFQVFYLIDVKSITCYLENKTVNLYYEVRTSEDGVNGEILSYENDEITLVEELDFKNINFSETILNYLNSNSLYSKDDWVEVV